MPFQRKINIQDWPTAVRTHRYWTKALERAEADEYADKPDEAREALKQIVTITPQAMTQWLSAYPNSTGWRRYQGAMRQSAYGREVLTKVSVSKPTAARLRRLAKSQGLSLDETIARLIDSVTS
jgi:hypothetical protein